MVLSKAGARLLATKINQSADHFLDKIMASLSLALLWYGSSLCCSSKERLELVSKVKSQKSNGHFHFGVTYQSLSPAGASAENRHATDGRMVMNENNVVF